MQGGQELHSEINSSPNQPTGWGVFQPSAGAWDGHKFICEDDFAVPDEGCLVYSFGLSKDISFEEAMAVRGKNAYLAAREHPFPLRPMKSIFHEVGFCTSRRGKNQV